MVVRATEHLFINRSAYGGHVAHINARQKVGINIGQSICYFYASDGLRRQACLNVQDKVMQIMALLVLFECPVMTFPYYFLPCQFFLHVGC